MTPAQRLTHRVGCVSFLNAKPLIDGLEHDPRLSIRFDVPSRLLRLLEQGEADVALCPVIDLLRSCVPLRMLQCGGIGCRGKTLTVRLFSQVPLSQITTVHADTDSHTSIMLMRVLLAEMLGIHPQVVDLVPGAQPRTQLLIGDKVVTATPSAELYPHQLDLGEAWLEHTGQPFVFAAWLAREDAELGDLPALLEENRVRNSHRIEQIVSRHAASHGWPADLALQYLGHWLRYELHEPEVQAVKLFLGKARALLRAEQEQVPAKLK